MTWDHASATMDKLWRIGGRPTNRNSDVLRGRMEFCFSRGLHIKPSSGRTCPILPEYSAAHRAGATWPPR